MDKTKENEKSNKITKILNKNLPNDNKQIIKEKLSTNGTNGTTILAKRIPKVLTEANKEKEGGKEISPETTEVKKRKYVYRPVPPPPPPPGNYSYSIKKYLLVEEEKVKIKSKPVFISNEYYNVYITIYIYL